jgi:hypothetical protein
MRKVELREMERNKVAEAYRRWALVYDVVCGPCFVKVGGQPWLRRNGSADEFFRLASHRPVTD